MFPAWLWLAGYAATAVVLALLWRRGTAGSAPRRFALLGFFSAVMILVMSLENPVIPYHFNLSVVAGIILGPRLSVLSALLVNTILALLGHGGVTVIGLNTLTLTTEMLVGYAAFHALTRAQRPPGPSAFVATVCGLAAGTVLSFFMVAMAAPYIDAMLGRFQGQDAHELTAVSGGHLSLTRLAVLMFGLGAIGWVIEGVLSSAIIGYLARYAPTTLAQPNLTEEVA